MQKLNSVNAVIYSTNHLYIGPEWPEFCQICIIQLHLKNVSLFHLQLQ